MKRKFFNLFFVLALFLLLLLIGISAFGQSYQTFRSERKRIKEEAKFKIGPFRIFPTIRFRNIGYDDNVYYQREEANPTSDFTGTFSPEVKVYLLLGNKLILSITENPEYVYFLKQKRERRFNNRLLPGFKFLFLNRFVISGDYSWSSRRWRASSEFDVRANVKSKIYNGRLFYETARRTSFGFSGSIRKIEYEDITIPGEEIWLSRALNREEKSGHIEFYYSILKKKGTFFMRGGYTVYKFEHVQTGWRDSYSYQAYSGISFPLLGRVRGTLSLGYKKLIPKEKEKKGFSGLVGNTSLSFRLLYFKFRLNYNRDTHFSYWTNNIFFNEDRYGGGVSFYFTKFMRVDYNFSYAEAHYPEPGLFRMPDGSYEEIKRKDIYRTHMIGLVFRIIKDTGVGVMVNFWERESNYYWENRNRSFIGGYLTYEF